MAREEGGRRLAPAMRRAGQCVLRALLASTLLAGSLVPVIAAETRQFTYAEPSYTLLATKSEYERGELRIQANHEIRPTGDGRSFGVLKIVGFDTGSPLPGKGVNVGDTILAVNGYIFSTAQKLVAFINSGSPGAYVNVDVETADGRLRTVNVPLVSWVGSVPPALVEKPLSIPTQSVPDRSYAQTPRSTNSEGWVGPAIVVGAAAIACAFLGCFDSDDEAPASGENNRRAYEPPRQAEQDADRGSAWDNVPPISPFYGDRTAPQVYGR